MDAHPSYDKEIPSFELRIIGGHKIKIQEAPYQVSIIWTLKNKHHCGGSIISKNWIVTAAHCASGFPFLYTIRSGSSYWNRDGHIHDVNKIIVHKEYDIERATNDIAMVKVRQPFVWSETTSFIPLFQNLKALKAGQEAVVTGWGKYFWIIIVYDLPREEKELMNGKPII